MQTVKIDGISCDDFFAVVEMLVLAGLSVDAKKVGDVFMVNAVESVDVVSAKTEVIKLDI